MNMIMFDKGVSFGETPCDKLTPYCPAPFFCLFFLKTQTAIEGNSRQTLRNPTQPVNVLLTYSKVNCPCLVAPIKRSISSAHFAPLKYLIALDFPKDFKHT